MNQYKTAAEKAKEWGVTSRHVQYLCREGKIDGVVKRAGVWFIPDNVPEPLKNMKSDDKSFKFIGTKKKIFENAMLLFMEKGYENVTLKDIAKMTYIRQTAIYNHFESKHKILETIYDFYSSNFLPPRAHVEKVHILIEKGDLIDIINKGLRYEYDDEIKTQMSYAVKIILQRTPLDARASELFQSLILEEGIKFVEDLLNDAVKVGRLAPHDSRSISLLFNSIRHNTLLWWLIKPHSIHFENALVDEQKAYTLIIKLLTDLRMPT